MELLAISCFCSICSSSTIKQTVILFMALTDLRVNSKSRARFVKDGKCCYCPPKKMFHVHTLLDQYMLPPYVAHSMDTRYPDSVSNYISYIRWFLFDGIFVNPSFLHCGSSKCQDAGGHRSGETVWHLTIPPHRIRSCEVSIQTVLGKQSHTADIRWRVV